MRRHLPVALVTLVTLVVLSAAPQPARASDAPAEVLHHRIDARVEPSTHRLWVKDTITVPGAWGDKDVISFRLHGRLKVENAPGWTFEMVAKPGTETDPEEVGQMLTVREWRLRPAAGSSLPEIEITYSGEIHHPLVSEGQEYARSFSRTPGTIQDEGVVISGSTWWLPRFDDELITFSLTADVPDGWDVVSQGTRTRHDVVDRGGPRRVVTWDCAHPMDEAYLIAAQFTEYERAAGKVSAQAFLRTPDPNMAAKYLEATAQYIDMYTRLIGPYPFDKFALVENFWETGYGMPSFTLLGPQIIRFPFILHSSYPHEILHNWWGNSVYVDWQSGNWCEGLTAYLADHLIREGQGRGTEYRRDSLKGYRDYVSGERDFPLTEFRSRHSSATQAIGYGKCLMVWHMLRRQMGEQNFQRALARFYRGEKFKVASWADVERVFETVTEREMRDFFAQWVERPGAPSLTVEAALDGEILQVTLRQVQGGEPYVLDVPIAITRAGSPDAEWRVVAMTEAETIVRLSAPDAVRVDVDPLFDLFRRLDQAETPPTLSQMFGAENVTIVVPDEDPLLEGWHGFAHSWAEGGAGKVQVVTASELATIPADRAVWVLGSTNPWRRSVLNAVAVHGAAASVDEIRFGLEATAAKDHSFVMVARHPLAENLSIGWVGADTAASLPGLARKLPHYGKYSFLAFQGDEPTNVVKGEWPATGSPLVAYVGEGRTTTPARGALPNRQPLARLAPVFDPDAIRAHVEFLADDAQEGRGVGSAGHDRARDYVVEQMKAAGLQAPKTGWLHTWTEEGGPEGQPETLANVVGMIPGVDPHLAGESVVITAHYDHLGLGWPDARDGQKGKVHNGADDNASGVAVMLEVAKLLGKDLRPARTVVFVATDGEEWGLKGARRYLSTAGSDMAPGHPTKRIHSMITLDTVGRLGDGKLLVLGSGTATEWRHIAMGIGFTTGIESTCVADTPGSSDHLAFHEAGIPAVQIFTGPTDDYHRPSDTADKIDVDGLLKVATWTREALVYLSSRREPLTSTLEGATNDAPSTPKQGRKVSLGTMPDFAFAGPGVKVASVLAGTPAETAGILAGDIILMVDGAPMFDLAAYQKAFLGKQPGDKLTIRVRRGEKDVELEATLVAR